MSTDYGSSGGYTIQDRVSIGKYFFSLGHNPNAVQPYVILQSNSETPHDFYWGHYFYTQQSALRDLHSRISGEVEFLLERIDKMAGREGKTAAQHDDVQQGDGRKIKNQLSIAQYDWLIRLVEKDLAHTQECHAQEPNRVFAIRIANMEELKTMLSGMKAGALAKENRAPQR